MTTPQIESAFNAAIEKRGIDKELNGISKDVIYNWRKGRGQKPNIGEMLGVLYQLGKIKIISNEPTPIP